MRYQNKQDYALELYLNNDGTGKPFVGKLSIDGIVESIAVENGYVKCYLKGNTGWIEERLLTKLDVAEPPPDELPLPPIPPDPAKPRGDGVFISVKNSMEVYDGLSRPSVILPKGNINEVGYPDMFGIRPENPKFTSGSKIGRAKPTFTVMTVDLCHWLFRLNVEKWQGWKFENEAAYMAWWKPLPKTNQLIKWWASLMKGDRSHTNRFGSDTCFDPISQPDQKDKELMRFFQVVTGRFCAKVNSIRTTTYKINCVNANSEYRLYHPDTHPWLFDEPLITARVKILDQFGKWDGKTWRHESRPYGQFDPASPILPAMLPYDSYAVIDQSICRLLDPYEETPGKYN